jgi:hypothetical protein
VQIIAPRGRRRVIRALVAAVVPCESSVIRQIDAGLRETLHEAVDGIRRGGRLRHMHAAIGFIQQTHIGEGATDIDGDTQNSHGMSPFPPRRERQRWKNNFVWKECGRSTDLMKCKARSVPAPRCTSDWLAVPLAGE